MTKRRHEPVHIEVPSTVEPEIENPEPEVDEDDEDDIDFDFGSMAANVASSLARQLHSDSLLYSTPSEFSTASKSKPKSAASSVPSLAEVTGAGRSKKFDLVHRKGVYQLPKEVVVSATSQHKSVLDSAGFLTAPTAPPVSAKEVKAGNKKETASKDTAGSRWFHMSAPTLTAEVKADLKMLALRSVLDPKRHYKADKSLSKFPKYFQMGTVVAGAAETYSARLSKSQRKQSLVDEIMADVQHRAYLKRRVATIQQHRSGDPAKRRFKAALHGAATKKK